MTYAFYLAQKAKQGKQCIDAAHQLCCRFVSAQILFHLCRRTSEAKFFLTITMTWKMANDIPIVFGYNCTPRLALIKKLASTRRYTPASKILAASASFLNLFALASPSSMPSPSIHDSSWTAFDSSTRQQCLCKRMPRVLMPAKHATFRHPSSSFAHYISSTCFEVQHFCNMSTLIRSNVMSLIVLNQSLRRCGAAFGGQDSQGSILQYSGSDKYQSQKSFQSSQFVSQAFRINLTFTEQEELQTEASSK